MYRYLDVLKWKNPGNPIEQQELLVVEDSSGIFVEVRHLIDGDYMEGTTKESFEDLDYVGHVTAYERPDEIWNKFRKM